MSGSNPISRALSTAARKTWRGVAASGLPSYHRASQMKRAVRSTHGITAALSGSGNRSWSPYPTSSWYRVPGTTSDRESRTLTPPYMLRPRSAYSPAWAIGIVFEREIPCMSGSSNRTNAIPSLRHPSRTLSTLSTRSLLLGAMPVRLRPQAFPTTVRAAEPAEPRDRSVVGGGDGRVPAPGGGAVRFDRATARPPLGTSDIHRARRARMTRGLIESSQTRVLPLEFERAYPVVVRGDGVWVEDAAGNRYLDAMSGGSMAATLGHGRSDLVGAARAQTERLAYVHNDRPTNPAQERLARELVDVAPEGFSRVRFVTSGSDANETSIQLARSYHVERGEPSRWQVISFAQAYHGPTMETLALTGRPGLHGPFGPYLPEHLHIPPSSSHHDPSGEAALEALDHALEQAGPENVSAFFCEGISAAALPAYTPPTRFWEGLAERRDRHGFLVCFDEVLTGVGRTGEWFAGNVTACTPDIIATAKGLGAGYVAIGAVLCREPVYEAIANGSRRFPLGHTFDGAPLSCAVGLAVLDALRKENLVDHVRERGARLREELASALDGVEMVEDVLGHGYLMGVTFVDPRDRTSYLPRELRVAGRIDEAAFTRDLITLSTQPTRDGYAADQTLFAPPFTTPEEDLVEMVSRFTDAVKSVAKDVESELSASTAAGGAS